MKTKYLFYFVFCILVFALISCHLDDKKGTTGVRHPVYGPGPSTTEDKQSFTWSGPMEFENTSKYRNLLRDYKRCDHCTNYIGRYECENFDSRADIKIQFEKIDYPAKATLIIQPYSERKLNFIEAYAGACGTIIHHSIPIELVGTANPLNDSNGFYVRFTGKTSFGNTGLGYVIITSEHTNPFEDGVLDVSIYYGGSTNDQFKVGTADLENPEIGHLYYDRRGTR